MHLSTAARRWGSTDVELAASYPCESFLPAPAERILRAVSIRATPAAVFRWVCQLKVAPYSYDLLDNLGRRSPRELTPGAERLAVGQRFMICRICAYDDGRHITGVSTPTASRLFGVQAITYQVNPVDPHECRLVVCLAVKADGWWSRARNGALAYGDLVMMRKQLLTLKELAESAAIAPSAHPVELQDQPRGTQG